MKIMLMCVGKIAYKPVKEAIDKFTERIPHYIPFEIKEIPDVKNAKAMSEAQQKESEGAAMLATLNNADFVALLDEKGKEYTSREFSSLIADKMLNLPGRLVFVIGGPYGFSEAMYARANAKLSMSKMTFTHEMARLFFVEQLYRAMTIMRGEPYHHD